MFLYHVGPTEALWGPCPSSVCGGHLQQNMLLTDFSHSVFACVFCVFVSCVFSTHLFTHVVHVCLCVVLLLLWLWLLCILRVRCIYIMLCLVCVSVKFRLGVWVGWQGGLGWVGCEKLKETGSVLFGSGLYSFV